MSCQTCHKLLCVCEFPSKSSLKRRVIQQGPSPAIKKALADTKRTIKMGCYDSVLRQLDTLILATPTGEVRDLLTDANIKVMMAQDKDGMR